MAGMEAVKREDIEAFEAARGELYALMAPPKRERFLSEYQGEFAQSSQGSRLRTLALEYLWLTEDYDQTVCRHRNDRGIAIPTTREERRECESHARDMMRRYTKKAREEGLEGSFEREVRAATPRFEDEYRFKA